LVVIGSVDPLVALEHVDERPGGSAAFVA